MVKVRVYQLAKELQVQSALILELLDRMGQEVKSDLSTLDERTSELVRVRVTSALTAEKERVAHELEAEPEIAEVPSGPADEGVATEGPGPKETGVEPPLETEEPLAAKPVGEEKPAAAPPAVVVEEVTNG